MMQEIGKTWPIQWQQLPLFVFGILVAYYLSVLYRKRRVPSEYHRSFFLSTVLFFPVIFFASYLINFQIMNALGYNAVVSFVDLVFLLTLFSIMFGLVGFWLAKSKKKLFSQ